MPPVTIVDRRTVYDAWVTLEVVVLDTTVRGEPVRIKREVHDHGNGSAVLVYDPDARTAILVRQIRPAALVSDGSGLMLEAMAGIVDPGEDPADTARREAEEEAGVIVGDLEFVGAPYSTPGSVTERVWIYLAPLKSRLPRDTGGVAEEHEEMEILEVPLRTLAALADAGEIIDMKTFILIETLRRRRPELFA
nr:NUDIX domain-containing protein [Chthonobacter rhizosphaerae]